MLDRQLPQSLSPSPSACSHTSQFPLWTKAMWIHTFTSLLSLTPLLRLVRGRVNPLLSRTHAAPIHRGSAQNARVQLCGTARSAGWEETRKWVTGQVTAHFYFLFFFSGRGAGIGVSLLSESAFSTGTGNMTLNPGRWHTTPQPLFEQRPTISAFVEGEDQTASRSWERPRVLSKE